jgi:hypothetical protein
VTWGRTKMRLLTGARTVDNFRECSDLWSYYILMLFCLGFCELVLVMWGFVPLTDTRMRESFTVWWQLYIYIYTHTQTQPALLRPQFCLSLTESIYRFHSVLRINVTKKWSCICKDGMVCSLRGKGLVCLYCFGETASSCETFSVFKTYTVVSFLFSLLTFFFLFNVLFFRFHIPLCHTASHVIIQLIRRWLCRRIQVNEQLHIAQFL